MTLTHDEIAAMTCGEVNKEIAKRLDQYEEWDSMGSDNMDCPDVFEEFPDYCGDWSYAGRLLQDMVTTEARTMYTPELSCSPDGSWGCQTYLPEAVEGIGATAPEAIARCWLEWWEVTHE